MMFAVLYKTGSGSQTIWSKYVLPHEAAAIDYCNMQWRAGRAAIIVAAERAEAGIRTREQANMRALGAVGWRHEES